MPRRKRTSTPQRTMNAVATATLPATPPTTSLPKCLIINPFHSGSHKHFIDTLTTYLHKHALTPPPMVYSLPGKKWHWRLLCSATHFAEILPTTPSTFNNKQGTLFTTSLLNLADLVALRPDLSKRTKILYFHENQFEYPESQGAIQQQQQSVSPNLKSRAASKQKWSEYGWAQIMSCLVADRVLFNSNHNRATFLKGVQQLIASIPTSSRPPSTVLDRIKSKSEILFYPIAVPQQLSSWSSSPLPSNSPLHVVWNHRWEYDKGPLELLTFMRRWAHQSKYTLILSIVGVQYPDRPSVFDTIENEFWHNPQSSSSLTLRHFGSIETVADYHQLLFNADVVLSTAKHEFFGVAIAEGVMCGCVPLCPNALSYPELYPKSCLYNTENQMFKQIKSYTSNVERFRTTTALNVLKEINVEQYTMKCLGEKYVKVLGFGGGGGGGGSGGGSSGGSDGSGGGGTWPPSCAPSLWIEWLDFRFGGFWFITFFSISLIFSLIFLKSQSKQGQ